MKKSASILPVSIAILAIILSIGLFVPTTVTGVSLSALYQLGMAQTIIGVLLFVGFVILFIDGLQKVRKQNRCAICGAKAQAHDDKFCRACGTSLSK